MKRRSKTHPGRYSEQNDVRWSLVREMGIDDPPSVERGNESPLRFPVYAERGPDGTYLIVDDLSVGKYLALSTRCKTLRIDPEGNVLYDSLEAGMADGYGCFMGDGRVALIARSGSEISIVSASGVKEDTIDLSTFSKGLPRLIRWTWRKTFLVQFLIRTGVIDILEITPDARLAWYLPRLPTLEIGFPGSIDLLTNDHLLLTDEARHLALEVTRNGEIVWSAGRPGFPSTAPDCLAAPKAVCDAGEGGRLIADTRNHRVLRIEPDGTVDEVRPDGASFCSPSFVGRSGDDGFLICDAGNRQIIEIDKAGRTRWRFGSGLGSRRWLSFPRSVEIFESGYLIADTANDRVVHARNGGITEVCSNKSAGLFWPRCARSLESGSLLIADARNSRIIEVSRDGEVSNALDSTDFPADLELRDPHDVRMLNNGHLLLVDASANRVIECDWSGKVFRIIGGGHGPVDLGDPHNVALLPHGQMLISDTRNNRIIRIDESNNLVNAFDAFGNERGYLRLSRPRYAEMSAGGLLVVADSDNNRIIGATLDGELLWEISQIPDSPLSGMIQPRWVHMFSNTDVLISDHLHHRIVHLRLC